MLIHWIVDISPCPHMSTHGTAHFKMENFTSGKLKINKATKKISFSITKGQPKVKEGKGPERHFGGGDTGE